MTTALKSSLKRTLTGAVCGVAFMSLLVVGISATRNQAGLSHTVQAQADASFQSAFPRRFNCTNGVLLGRYATKGDGFVPGGPPPAPLVPFATVSLMTFDGFGHLTNAVTASTNGVISSNVNPGTYSLNDDCTGKMTIIIPAPPFQLNFDLVVADQGKEFYTIATTPSVVTVSGKRVQ